MLKKKLSTLILILNILLKVYIYKIVEKRNDFCGKSPDVRNF